MSDVQPIDAINPRTGVADYRFVPPSEAELAQIARRLRGAQQAWANATLEHRIGVMRRWADAIKARADEITAAESADTGRYRLSKEAPHLVVAAIHGWCDKAPAMIAAARYDGPSSIMPHVRLESQFSPYPLLGVVSPWNQPLVLSLMDAVPALLAGCAVIVKPSEVTPRFVEPVMASVNDVKEIAAVFQMVQGGPATGRALIELSDIFCFTGSIKTGRIIAEACAKRFIPVFLELGGKDPVIITADANLDHAAASVLRGSVYATGQVCFAIERVYVHASVHDEFVDRLVRKAAKIEVNYPDIHKGHIGPFTMQRQAAIADEHLADAVAKGAKIVLGGPSETLGGGLYMRPTIVVDVDHTMKLMTEETFAPITPVMRYNTTEEAIRLANDSEYGLSASVIAGSLDEAKAIAAHIEAGAISLQDSALTLAMLRDGEKQSYKLSGMGGSRMGANAIPRFFRKTTLVHSSLAPVEMETLAEI